MSNQEQDDGETNEAREWIVDPANFVAQDFIQASLRAPDTVVSVLSFMFGVDYRDPQDIARGMRTGQSVFDMRGFWFSAGAPFDEVCLPFRDLVRAAGAGKLAGPEWNETVDGKLAQLLLCDQLSRNIFRGSQEAFASDATSLKLARVLSDNLLGHVESGAEPLSGEFYPPYLVFLLTALMHSERVEDHRELARVLDYADAEAPPVLHEWFRLMRRGSQAHTDVVERFGRYPHRNAAHGRTHTSDEAAWLADVDNLPSWAKSQLVVKS